MDNLDFDYLKSLPNLGVKLGLLDMIHEAWWADDNEVYAVARILIDNKELKTPQQVLDFVENPVKYERSIQELIREFEKEATVK